MLGLGVGIDSLAFTVSWTTSSRVLSQGGAYTAGPHPMAYCGTADAVVLLMFGPVGYGDHLRPVVR